MVILNTLNQHENVCMTTMYDNITWIRNLRICGSSSGNLSTINSCSSFFSATNPLKVKKNMDFNQFFWQCFP